MHGAVRKLQLRFRQRSLPMGYEPVQVGMGQGGAGRQGGVGRAE